jgi:glucan biosynthesis protein C
MAPMHDLKRLHGLDALRASMMLLGLVLHSAASYPRTSLGQAWPYQDAQTSALFDPVIFIIHLFRMPTFFVMAGFFAALLFYREGPAGFLVHRVRRVLLPFFVAWIVLFPMMVFGFTLALMGGGFGNVAGALQATVAAPYTPTVLAHLWFLYYLFMICVVAAVVVRLVGYVPLATRARFTAIFGGLAPTAAGCVTLGLLSGFTMLPMSAPMLDTPAAFVPTARVLVAYAVFLSFGWLLFVRRDLVPSFGRHPWRYLMVGLLMSVAYLASVLQPPFINPDAAHVASVMLGGVAMWLLVYGLIGIFVRYAAHPSPLQRYLADGSYWIYLVHLPVVSWFVGLLAPAPLSAVSKFALVLTGTTIVTVATYHLFVRSTVIGAFLNGRRFERGLPRPEPASAIVPSQVT